MPQERVFDLVGRLASGLTETARGVRPGPLVARQGMAVPVGHTGSLSPGSTLDALSPSAGRSQGRTPRRTSGAMRFTSDGDRFVSKKLTDHNTDPV